MGWEKRGERRYYYRSVRRDGSVKKVYHGKGPAGELAAGADALRRAERKAEQEALRAADDRISAAVALNVDMDRACAVLAAATLLAAGYHRPNRHAWRPWRDGRRTLEQAR